jgi:hypothetical protein
LSYVVFGVAYSSSIVEEGFEEVIFFPHLSCFKAQLQINWVPQADTHDLVQVIAG